MVVNVEVKVRAADGSDYEDYDGSGTGGRGGKLRN